MPAIPMTSDTEISLPSSSFSKLNRSPYLSSMCVDDNGCHETTATTSSPRHASIHRHRHRHMPRPTSSYVSDLFELLRPATARHDATASATFHPYLLPEDGEDGDSCPSSAASTEIIDNRLREGGGKITMRRAKRGGSSGRQEEVPLVVVGHCSVVVFSFRFQSSVLLSPTFQSGQCALVRCRRFCGCHCRRCFGRDCACDIQERGFSPFQCR